MFPVKLYVYDLSNGMARQLSRQLTGRQIDGIWHTSVVVFGREIWYGQGISTAQPGRSHHGAPLQVIDMGETTIDEETFNDYIDEMRDHYTADKVLFTLLEFPKELSLAIEFNCNSFTNDVIGFLTGGSIPGHIQDLPTDFLSTPFGAALRPTIDAMYRRPTSNTPTPPIPAPSISTAPSAAPNPELAASILQAVAAQAQPGSLPIAATETLAAPLRVITNPPAFQSFLETHRAAVALFTSETCPPCRMIEPVFERLSEEKGVKSDGTGAGFAKIDISVGLGNSLASEWGIRATPTFLFFLDGRKLDELKGANANELRSQVDLLLFQAFPPHPHTSLSLPAVQAISLKPILFTQVPAIDAVLNKLSSFIDSTPWPSIPQTPAQVKQILSGIIAPYLKARFAPSPSANENLPSATPSILTPWAYATNTLGSSLPVSSLFPLVDLWRLALLDPSVGAWAASTPLSGPIPLFLEKASTALKTPGSTSNPRNYLLTVLRLLSNAFATPALAQSLFLTTRAALAEVVIPSLLHPDGAVRTAAASLAFNVAEFLQKGRVDKVKGSSSASVQEDEEWEVEMISAVVEALDRETTSEEVVHRLTASLAFLVRLSPVYETQVLPLLDVLQARAILKHKLSKGGCGEEGVTKRDVRKLVEEVASKLCP